MDFDHIGVTTLDLCTAPQFLHYVVEILYISFRFSRTVELEKTFGDDVVPAEGFFDQSFSCPKGHLGPFEKVKITYVSY